MSLMEGLNRRGDGTLPRLVGVEIAAAEEGRITSRLALRDDLMAPNGYLHAAAIVALADTSCGYGCFVTLPENASGFMTVELKSNSLGTNREGAIACEASLVHDGHATQVWTRPSRTKSSARSWRSSATRR